MPFELSIIALKDMFPGMNYKKKKYKNMIDSYSYIFKILSIFT